MSRNQIKADIAENREEDNMNQEQVKAQDWDETLESPESEDFLNSLIDKAMQEIEEKK